VGKKCLMVNKDMLEELVSKNMWEQQVGKGM
jgi:hypothetical protein